MNSLRFEELNKKCKKIKRKKFLKVFLIVFFLILIVIGLCLLFYSKIDNKNSNLKKTLSLKSKKITIPAQDKNSTLIKAIDKKSKPKVTKDKHKKILKMKKNDKVKKDKILLNPTLDIPDINTSNLLNKERKAPFARKLEVKPIAKKVQEIQTKKKPFKISVKHVDQESVLIKNYKNLKNYKNALNLATFYFDKKNYKKCIYWAKIASQLGKTADTPWLLYAKAKYNLNQKEDAIKSLQMYLNYFDSKEAYELLRKFKKERK